GIENVTIPRSRTYLGRTVLKSATTPDVMLAQFNAGSLLQPPRFRRAIECDIAIMLAADEAVHAYAPVLETGYVPSDPHEVEVQQLVQDAVGMDDGVLDEDRAKRKVGAVLGTQVGHSYLEWLRVETRVLVNSPRFAALLDALVPELLKRKTMSGRAVRAVFREVEGSG